MFSLWFVSLDACFTLNYKNSDRRREGGREKKKEGGDGKKRGGPEGGKG